jgi:hypothetical protein
MKQALIEVQNLSKSYRRDSLEIPVLRNISLNVQEGEFIAFMRPVREKPRFSTSSPASIDLVKGVF